jgi:L-ribulokinase
LRFDPVIRKNIFSFVELCDWIPALLTGIKDPLKLKRSRCAAGHKAMWHPSWNGLPPEEFLVKLDPILKDFRSRLYNETYTSDEKAGVLSAEWAKRLGLREDVAVGVGAFDAHMGAVGGEIEPYTMAKIMGTSTCDILTAPENMLGTKLVKGICGQVDGSVIPGMLGMEAGQSSFGDVYAWFKDLLIWPLESIKVNDKIDPEAKQEFIREVSDKIIEQLSEEASKLPIDESGVLAVDWLNGRRTPYANQLLKGAIVGLNLGTDAPKIFRALVEATAFGAKKIVDCFMMQDIPINGVIGLGGVAKKSPFILQVVCDVLNIPIKIPKSEQTCALGAAMFAAVAAGIYNSIDEAKKAMGSGFEKEYIPNPENAAKYAVLYEKYSRLSSFIEQELTD